MRAGAPNAQERAGRETGLGARLSDATMTVSCARVGSGDRAAVRLTVARPPRRSAEGMSMELTAWS